MGEKKYTVDEIIKIGTEVGIKAGMEYIRKEKEQRKKGRYDRRLRNTKLLLREYRTLKIHSKDAVYSLGGAKAIDILDELDSFEYDDNLYIESIKKSKERTAVIISHVNQMMNIFKQLCENSKNIEDARKYKVIHSQFIAEEEITVEELAQQLNVHPRTVYKDIDNAVKTISSLMFGIDGLKMF